MLANGRVVLVYRLIAWTILTVVVDDAACLKVGIHRHRAQILKAIGLQLLRDGIRQPIADGDAAFFVAYVQYGFSATECPQPMAEATMLLLYFLETLGVVDNCFDLTSGTNHARRIHDTFYVCVRIGSDFFVVESVEAFPEDLPFFNHQAPG